MTDLARARFEQSLGHRYRNPNLLLQALTHRSFANERGSSVGHNERLEFLGDSVLGLAISHVLVERFPEHSEGTLSRFRASMVSAPSLASVAARIGIGDCLRLGRGEELTGGREKPSLLADAYEAVLASLYLDGGIDAAFAAVQRHFAEALAELSHGDASFDAKTRLQELVQGTLKVTPSYRVVSASGPDHEKIFESEIRVLDDVLATGFGRNKKEAEQRAAQTALGVWSERQREASTGTGTAIGVASAVERRPGVEAPVAADASSAPAPLVPSVPDTDGQG